VGEIKGYERDDDGDGGGGGGQWECMHVGGLPRIRGSPPLTRLRLLGCCTHRFSPNVKVAGVHVIVVIEK